jgi:hypothetical protein
VSSQSTTSVNLVVSQDEQLNPVRQSVRLDKYELSSCVEQGEGRSGDSRPAEAPEHRGWSLSMHNQGTAAAQRSEASSSPRAQCAAVLQELRAELAEADRRIDRLMVIRRRQLAGLSVDRQLADLHPVPCVGRVPAVQQAAGLASSEPELDASI